MSVANTSFDSEDSEINRLDRYPSSRESFTSWGFIQLLSSSLYPPSYQLRPIEDKGAICDSLSESKVDLFNRVRINEGQFIRVARMIGILASFVFIRVVIAPLGICYHGYFSLKYAVLCLTRLGDPEFSRKERDKHANSLLIDFVNGAFPFLVACSGATVSLLAGVCAATVVSLAVFGHGLMDAREMLCMQIEPKDRYGLYKSIMIRNLFGIVDEKTGGLLSWDRARDNDIEAKKGYGYSFHGSYQLNGYFATLYKEQAVEFLKVIQALQTALPLNCKIPAFYPPKSSTIIAFLNENRASCGLSDAEITDWENKIQTVEGNIKSLWEIMSQSYAASSKETVTEFGRKVKKSYTLQENFPIPEEICRDYFK